MAKAIMDFRLVSLELFFFSSFYTSVLCQSLNPLHLMLYFKRASFTSVNVHMNCLENFSEKSSFGSAAHGSGLGFTFPYQHRETQMPVCGPFLW